MYIELLYWLMLINLKAFSTNNTEQHADCIFYSWFISDKVLHNQNESRRSIVLVS